MIFGWSKYATWNTRYYWAFYTCVCASDDCFTAVTVDAEFVVGAGRFVLQLEFGDAQSNRMTDSDGGSQVQLPAMVIKAEMINCRFLGT